MEVTIAKCFECGLESNINFSNHGSCPACGRNHHLIYGNRKMWQQLATLRAVRQGVTLPNAMKSPWCGPESRIHAILKFMKAVK